ncbi:MAG: hypothetical protein JWO78_191 [Micavibrio sp.]|nr:hypothetical protein [Micavibrio sp.]
MTQGFWMAIKIVERANINAPTGIDKLYILDALHAPPGWLPAGGNTLEEAKEQARQDYIKHRDAGVPVPHLLELTIARPVIECVFIEID